MMQVIETKDATKSRYNLAEPDMSAKWSGVKFPTPPAVGTRIHVNFNGLGSGIIQGYFVEHGFLGVQVLPDNRPAWHVKQNGDKNYYLVFGIEIEPIA